MKRSSKAAGTLLIIIFLIAVGHSIAHFYIWGINIPGLDRIGITGYQLTEEDYLNEKKYFGVGISTSQILVALEWILVFFILVFAYTKSMSHFKEEVNELKSGKEKNVKGHRTDIDKLYDMLKEKERIRFLAIEKAFNVDRGVVIGWAKTLETGNMATVDYPRIGEPELVLVEKE